MLKNTLQLLLSLRKLKHKRRTTNTFQYAHTANVLVLQYNWTRLDLYLFLDQYIFYYTPDP